MLCNALIYKSTRSLLQFFLGHVTRYFKRTNVLYNALF